MWVENDLEKLGSVDVVSYKSKFSLFFPQRGGILQSKPSALSEGNHVEIALNGVVALQLFKTMWGFSGNFLSQNFSQNLEKKIEILLAKNGYYTREMAWKYAPWIPLILLSGMVVCILGSGVFIIDFLLSQDMINYRLFLIGANLVLATYFICLYRQFFSSETD